MFFDKLSDSFSNNILHHGMSKFTLTECNEVNVEAGRSCESFVFCCISAQRHNFKRSARHVKNFSCRNMDAFSFVLSFLPLRYISNY